MPSKPNMMMATEVLVLIPMESLTIKLTCRYGAQRIRGQLQRLVSQEPAPYGPSAYGSRGDTTRNLWHWRLRQAQRP